MNHGGNPVEGSTGLCSVEVTTAALTGTEFVLVLLDKAVRGGVVHHAQLRFIFAEAESPRLLGVASEELGSNNRVGDLILSWEAWRAPGAGFSVFTGLDPASYDLSLRAYSGPQRFLEDALGPRDWYCYPLRLPGGDAGLAELLRVSIALGDGLARATVTRRLAEIPTDSSVSWESFRQAAAPVSDADAIELPPKELQTYQTLLRSCATMALYSITATLDRLRESGHVDGVDWDKVPRSPIDKEEPWMMEAAANELSAVGKSAARALSFFKRYPAAIPGRIPELLHKAGLIVSDGKNKAVCHHYSLRKQTPYSKLAENLIR